MIYIAVIIAVLICLIIACIGFEIADRRKAKAWDEWEREVRQRLGV